MSFPLALAAPTPPPPPPAPLSQTFHKIKDDSKTVTKKVQWKTIAPINLDKNCFWTKNGKDEPPPIVEKRFAELSKNFSLKTFDNSSKKITASTKIDLQVLTAAAALNLSILLRVEFKNVPKDEVIRHIINCDTSALSVNFVEQLIKSIPRPHEIAKLHKLKKTNVVLADVEEFIASLCELNRILPRLDCILFKLRYDQMIENVKPVLEKSTAACQELIASKKFGRILQVILSIGNYLNSGSFIGNAVGFELPILTHLNEIKSNDNKKTLLHFLVQTIEKDFPELLSFGDEIIHVNDAAILDVDKIESLMQKLADSLTMLKQELLANNDNNVFQ